jgi:hypothetical protein
MASIKSDDNQKTIAQIALQFSASQSEQIIGAEPTDEELAALYENKLDSTRRAQIMSHIANSPALHTRWIRYVETLSYLNVPVKELPKTQINNKNRFSTFIDNLFNKKSVFAGGFATAAILVIVVSILPQQNDIDVQLSLNGAYDQWGGSLEQEWNQLPTGQKPTPNYASDRSFFSEPKEKSELQQVLETGFKISMNKIGKKPFKDYGIDSSILSTVSSADVSNSMTASHYEALKHTGQIAGLAAVQCKLDVKSPRVDELKTALEALQKQLNNLQIKDSILLKSAMKTENKNAVCATAQFVVDIITKE